MGKRGRPTKSEEKPWRNEELLYDLYWCEWMTAEEVADEIGCSKRTVLVWMDKYEIPKREPRRMAEPAYYETDHRGYERWTTDVDGTTINIQVHRLVMVANGELDTYWDKKVVHHRNQVKWDNRVENLEVKSVEEHARDHADERELERDDFGRIETWEVTATH